MPFCRKKVFSHDTIWWYQFLAINSCLFFPLGLSHSRFFLDPVLSYFYQCNGHWITHLVVSKFMKDYKKDDFRLQHASCYVQSQPVMWLRSNLRSHFGWNLKCAWVQCIFRLVKCDRNYAHLLVRFSDHQKTVSLIVNPVVAKRYKKFMTSKLSTVNNYMQVTGIATGENFAFFIYRHSVEIS